LGIVQALKGSGAGQVADVATKVTGLQLVGKQIVGAARSISWVMVVVGVIEFILKNVLGYGQLITVLSIILFIMAGFALAARLGKDKLAIFIPMILFVIWYFLYSATFDPAFLAVYLSVGFGIMALFGIISKGQSVISSLAGFLPCLVLLVDVGYLALLVGKVGIPVTNFMVGLLKYMPWWAFFGVMTLPTEEGGRGNALIQLTRIAGIVYIVFVLIAPVFPNIGREDLNALPGLAEAQQAQKDLQEQFSTCENEQRSYRLECIGQSFGKIFDTGETFSVDNCIAEKTKECEIDFQCLTQQGLQANSANRRTPAYMECKASFTAKGGQSVVGIKDETIKEAMTAKFSDRKSLTGQYRSGDFLHPIDFMVENPRNDDFNVLFSCGFTSTIDSKLKVPGTIIASGAQGNLLNVKDKSVKSTVACKPQLTLVKGKYKIEYQAELQGIQSFARLQRAFIAPQASERERENLIKRIMQLHFPGQKYLSQAPAGLFEVQWSFGQEDAPIVESGNILPLAIVLRNTGQGEIETVNWYRINMEGFSTDPNDCLAGTNIALLQDTKVAKVDLNFCYITGLPIDLSTLSQDYAYREYTAEANLNYLIKATDNVEVLDANQGATPINISAEGDVA